MRYENVVADFAKRTQANLERVERLARENPNSEVFEVTQLINSMLGLLVFPKEGYFNSIPEKSFDELRQEGWQLPRTRGDYPQVSNLRELIRYLRNSISHFNIEFQANENTYEIYGLKVWNKNIRGVTNWEADLTIAELRDLTYRFIEMLFSLKK